MIAAAVAPDPVGVPEEPPGPPSAGFAHFWRDARMLWTGDGRVSAWLLSAAAIVLVVAGVMVQVALTEWGKTFFDALDRRDTDAAMRLIGLFVALAAASATCMVGLLWTRMGLQIRWRALLSGRLMERWLAEQRFYRISIVAREMENPEYRILEDARMATEPLVDFAIGLGQAVLSAAMFIGILFVVGGAATIELGGQVVVVPAFLVIAAIVYAVVVSGAMIRLGRPLVHRVDRKNESEAQLRFELTRVRENAESIAMIGGENEERDGLRTRLAEVVGRWNGVRRGQTLTTCLSGAHAVTMPILPLLLAAPKYLSGEITLGTLMQLAAAFVFVLTALNWIVDNYIRLADWLAAMRRVAELTALLDDLDESVGEDAGAHIEIVESADDAIHLIELSLAHPSGKVLLEDADVVIARGDRVLVAGDSGAGKSTLIRAIAGLWTWGAGKVAIPAGARVAFLPQRPYLPLGSLRAALCYPNPVESTDDAALAVALKRCGLGRLASRLDEEERWDRILSGGELQRLAFARLLVFAPDVIIMDEATAALDETGQEHLMALLDEELAGRTVISVGHRPGLEQWHERKLTIVRRPRAARLKAERTGPRRRKLLRRVLARN